MKSLFIALSLFLIQNVYSQIKPENDLSANVRLSFLLFPFTPLLTFEVRTIANFTLQLETNFVNTHGVNLKYFIKNRMEGNYAFASIAVVENELLREDKAFTFLPYAGFGNAYRFGNSKQWIFDNRIGLGATINADNNSFYPVIKTGLGRIF